jgi:hypothetical protein
MSLLHYYSSIGVQCEEHTHKWLVSVGWVVPVLNWAPRHKDVLGEWRYSSTHSLTSALDGGSGQLHAPAALPPGGEPPVPIG